MTDETSEGVETLLGEPKRAIIRLSVPMVVAMSAQTLYNLTDAIWVSGLGPNALSAVGFFFPFFFLGMAISNGIAVGAGSAVSRAIGRRDRDRADRIATHAMVIMVGAAVLFTVPMLLFIGPVLRLMGAEGAALDLAISYARIMFAGNIVLFFTNVANGLLRSEGDAKRAMRAMMAGAGLNIVLDPVFIYVLDLGVTGAAWASIFSMAVVSVVVGRWLFLKRDTWVTFRFRGFEPERVISLEIARVGVPASVMHMSMFLMAFFITAIVARVGGTDGVAVYTTGWRVLSLAILPMLGVASAVTPVCGAALGAGEVGKLRSSYLYGLKLGVMLETVVAVGTFALAPLITKIFTWSEESAHLAEDLTTFLRVIWLFYPAVAFGMVSSSLFQGVGKGTTALAMTIVRTLVFTVPLTWIFAIGIDGGLVGAWWGIVIGHLAYAPLAFGWSMRHIAKLSRETGTER